MDPGGAIAPAVHLGPPSDYRAGVGQECDADGHTRLRNVPSSLARRLAAGHADKDAHAADEWRKWRRDRILAASETVGVG